MWLVGWAVFGVDLLVFSLDMRSRKILGDWDLTSRNSWLVGSCAFKMFPTFLLCKLVAGWCGCVVHDLLMCCLTSGFFLLHDFDFA